MFLSRLILNAKHPRVRSEVDHPYELHRTICKAFDNPDEARILFRADTERPGEVHVLVQSLVAPDWGCLDGEKLYVKSADDPKPVELAGLQHGMPLRFRLRCRPSMRIAEAGHPEEGKRKSLKNREEIFAWLQRKADESGFDVPNVAFDRVYWYESKSGKDQKPLGAVQFDGVLIVTDPERLREPVRKGIGPQKAYGFGLLSLAPAKLK